MANGSAAAARSTPWRSAFLPLIRRSSTIHVITIVLAAVFLVLAARHQWFFFDEWAFLVPSESTNLLAPHVGHWSTSPILITHALRAVFGVNTYWPYILLSMAVHVAICHVLWRIMRRIGVNAWIATALAFLLLLLGSGAENILWAFQIGFMGALLIGLVVILLVDAPAPLTVPRIVAVIVLSIWALTFSGTAIPVLVAAGLVALVRRGVAKTALMFGPSAVIYLAWYLLVARPAHEPYYGPLGLGELGTGVPVFAGHIFVDGFGAVIPIVGFGALALFSLLVWFAVTARQWKGVGLAGYALAGGAVVQAFLTGFTRLALGVQTAGSGRYVYALVCFMLPVIGLALTWFVRERQATLRVVVVLLLILVGYNATLLAQAARAQASIELGTQAKLYAALSLLDAPGASYDKNLRADPQYAPDVSLGDLAEMQKVGWISIGHFDKAALYSVEAQLQLGVVADAGAPTVRSCTSVPSRTPTTALVGTGTVFVKTSNSSTVELSISVNGTSGDPRTITIGKGWTTITSQATADLVISSNHDVDVCE